MEPAFCPGRQTSHEPPVCLGSRALSFPKPPATQWSDKRALQLNTKQAWEAGGVRPEGTHTAQRMGRQQVLGWREGGRQRETWAGQQRESRQEGEGGGASREGRQPDSAGLGRREMKRSVNAKRQRPGEAGEHSAQAAGQTPGMTLTMFPLPSHLQCPGKPQAWGLDDRADCHGGHSPLPKHTIWAAHSSALY